MISILSPTAPAGMPSPRRSTSTAATSPTGARSKRTPRTSSRRTRLRLPPCRRSAGPSTRSIPNRSASCPRPLRKPPRAPSSRGWRRSAPDARLWIPHWRRSPGRATKPKSLEDLGAVITGVNDAPQEGGDLFARSDSGQDPPGGLSSIQSSPVPAAMLADQRAREAKYGNGAVTPALMASADPVPQTFATPSGRPSIRDASEGTKLDPLLNKTWDLRPTPRRCRPTSRRSTERRRGPGSPFSATIPPPVRQGRRGRPRAAFPR